jgi:hypothetical protein
LNADLSAAPEIAQLAMPLMPARYATAAPRTVGRVAGDLADLAAAPERWWDLVRFDAHGPVRVPLPDAPGAWLLVLPPDTAADCDCSQATALAGEAVEGAEGAELTDGDGHGSPRRPLQPGRVLVRGVPAPHRVVATGPGYSVTLHSG